jgi:hypothetical protein
MMIVTIFSCEAGISTTVLMKFCDEGFNDTDANQLASFLNAWAKIVRRTFEIDRLVTDVAIFRFQLNRSGVFLLHGATSSETVHQQEFSKFSTVSNKCIA